MIHYLIIAIPVILANSWHVIATSLNRPEHTYFTGIAHYFADYFLYTSLMAQKGIIWTEHLFTNEQLPPTWIYWLYTILGKLGNSFVVYNISIAVFSAIALWLWWSILQRITPHSLTRIVALLFIATASGFAGSTFWFSPTPALNRLGGVPHQIFQTILLLSVILVFSSLVQDNKKTSFPLLVSRYSLLILISFLGSIANPIQMLLVVISATVTTVSALAPVAHKKNFRLRAAAPYILPVFFLALPALVGAYLTNTEFDRQPILVTAKLWENAQPVSVSPWQFILAIGPIAALVPFGLMMTSFLISATPLSIFLLAYGAISAAIFFSPVPHLLGTSPVRWLSPAAYGIIPILAAFGLTSVVSYCSKAISRFFHDASGIMKKPPQAYLVAIFFMLYAVFTVPSLLTQIDARTTPLRTDPTLYTLNHVPRAVIQAITKLGAPRTYTDVVLTDPALVYDVLIPVFTGWKSFTGHPVHTMYPDVKYTLRKHFFEGTMREAEVYQFMKDHHIRAVLTSSGAARMLTAYPFMIRVFQNEAITVFTVGSL